MKVMDIDFIVDKKDVDRHLLAIAASLTGPAMVMFHKVALEPHLRRRAKDRFQGEGDSASGPWAPLMESREQIRMNQGYSEGPINNASGDLEEWITNGNNTFTFGPESANFSMPGRGTVGQRAKLLTAQQGKPAGFPMPDGHGGVKPSPSPAAPRPVVALDGVDLAHVIAAFPIWLGSEVGKRL